MIGIGRVHGWLTGVLFSAVILMRSASASADVVWSDSFATGDSADLNAAIATRSRGSANVQYDTKAVSGQQNGNWSISSEQLSFSGDGTDSRDLYPVNRGNGGYQNLFGFIGGERYEISFSISVLPGSDSPVDSVGIALSDNALGVPELQIGQIRARSQLDVNVNGILEQRYDEWSEGQAYTIKLVVDETRETPVYEVYVDQVLKHSGAISFGADLRYVYFKLRDISGDMRAVIDDFRIETVPVRSEVYRAWMDEYTEISPEYRGPEQDADQDGFANVLEQSLVANPADEGSIPHYRMEEDQLLCHVPPADDGYRLFLQWKTSLTNNAAWAVLSNTVYETLVDYGGFRLVEAVMEDVVWDGDCGFFRFIVEVPDDERLPVTDVRDFGVNMNDAQDDTAAFQAALDQGGIITVPPGIAFLSSTLSVPPGTWLIGSGMASSELRWSGAASSGGLSGGSMALSGLWLRAMTPVASSAISCTNGPFHASNITMSAGRWKKGIHIDSCTNSFVSTIKFNGDSNTVAAIQYDGDCVDAVMEDIHIQNTTRGKGVWITGDLNNLTARRVTVINNDYSVYIDPPNTASNVRFYDLDTQAIRGSLWLKNAVDFVCYSAYLALGDWDSPLYEGAVTIQGNCSNLLFSGIRIQSNYNIQDTDRGILIKQCDGADFIATDIRSVKWGFIAESAATNITIDGMNFYDDVDVGYSLKSGSDVHEVPYMKLK